MDVNGAKALKKRLGQHGTGQAPPAAAADVAEDAPPVYHWFGMSQAAPEEPAPAAGDDTTTSRLTLFRRLGLSLR